MIKPHEAGLLNVLSKRTAPILTRCVANRVTGRFTRLFEIYLAILQGKGSGAGWDLQGEVRVAKTCITRDNAVIFDVGANVGAYSAALRQALYPRTCRTFQFEPAPACIRILQKNRHPLTTVVPVALGSRPGREHLYSGEPGSPHASLSARRDTYHWSPHPARVDEVPVTTLALAMQSFGVTSIDFLKVDVEGHELAVLQGAGDALRPAIIRAIGFEFGSGNINTRTFFHDIWDLLHPRGYQLARIAPGGRLIPVTEYYEDLEYFRGVTNYLATG